MSVQAIDWVLRHSPTKGSDRLVLISIANHTGGEEWESWPGVELIRQEAGLDRLRTVQDALTRLVESGAIERVINGAPDERMRADRRSNLYRIRTDHGVPCGDTRCCHGVSDRAERGDVSRRDGVSDSDGTGCRDASPKPSVEPSEEPSLEPRSEIEDLCEQLATAIEQHRGGARPKVSPRWHRDMRLLIERGPTELDEVTPVPVERVRAGITFTFTRLNTPEGRGSFCWADQIRSPGNLRRHWLALEQEGRKAKRSTRSRGQSAIDRFQQARIAESPPTGELLALPWVAETRS